MASVRVWPRLLIVLSAVLLLMLALACAAEEEAEPTAAPTTAPAAPTAMPAAPTAMPAPAATAAPAPAGGIDRGGTLVFPTNEGIISFDVHWTGTYNAVQPVGSTYNAILTYDQNEPGVILPELAESWEVDSAGTTWTFLLRDDVNFHSGTPFSCAGRQGVAGQDGEHQGEQPGRRAQALR